MFKMSNRSKAFLEQNFSDFFEHENLDDALMALDDFIVMEGLDENDNMTAFGHEAQAVYDDIYMHN